MRLDHLEKRWQMEQVRVMVLVVEDNRIPVTALVIRPGLLRFRRPGQAAWESLATQAETRVEVEEGWD